MDTTFSYLDQQIEGWKRSLSKTSISIDDQDELKCHMDDLIHELRTNGLPDDEIWLLAVKRIGSIDVIEAEFNKVTPNVRSRKNFILLVCGASVFVTMQLIFILLPAYLIKQQCQQPLKNPSETLDWATICLGLAISLLILILWLGLAGNRIVSYIKFILARFRIGFTFLVIPVLLASAYITIQLIDIQDLNVPHGFKTSFKTISILFYMTMIIVSVYAACLANNLELRTIQAFNRRINWKTALLIGILAGLAVTFGYTYHINYLPAIIGCPLFALIGWMVSYSQKPIINLIIVQLYIMGLWLSGICGEYATIFHIYYFIDLLVLIIGYFFGRSRLATSQPMNI